MLGLPKGSLEESTKNLFAKAGWKITTSSRSYRPVIDDPELDGRFIRAQEVSRYVEHGFFDCGLTGQDWVQENNSDVIEVCDLIYSRASIKKSRWVLCVPEGSTVKSAADLAGKRVATELVNTTKRYFEQKGVKVEVGDQLPSAQYAERLQRVPPAWEKAFEVNAARDPAVRASCIEFILAGLYATERISRLQSHGRTVYDTGGFR